MMRTLAASSAFFRSQCDQKSTVRALSESLRAFSESFRDTFEYVRARRTILTYVNSAKTF